VQLTIVQLGHHAKDATYYTSTEHLLLPPNLTIIDLLPAGDQVLGRYIEIKIRHTTR
jgi:hypothetical protein